MSDAVHRIARPRLIRSLAAATVALGFTGAGLALALSGGAGAHASGTQTAHVAAAAAPLSVRTAGTQSKWPYFACVAVGNYGICLGPPTN
jgi:hypothetical protein